MADNVSTGLSFGERIKAFFNNIVEKLNLSKERVLEFAIYAAIGFLAGFIFKRFGVVFAWIVGIGVLLFALDQLGVITFSINWVKIQELSGMQSVSTPDSSFMSNGLNWAKGHVFQVIMLVVGFLLGLRVG